MSFKIQRKMDLLRMIMTLIILKKEMTKNRKEKRRMKVKMKESKGNFYYLK